MPGLRTIIVFAFLFPAALALYGYGLLPGHLNGRPATPKRAVEHCVISPFLGYHIAVAGHDAKLSRKRLICRTDIHRNLGFGERQWPTSRPSSSSEPRAASAWRS